MEGIRRAFGVHLHLSSWYAHHFTLKSLGQMNGVKKSSFCCHRDNIFLHTLLAALWRIVGASPSTPFLCFSFSTGQDVSERVWGGGGGVCRSV